MTLIIHNIKVAFRNLMRYKLQTFISVLSLAVGIVTLAFTHSMLLLCRAPLIQDIPYFERTYHIQFKSGVEDERVRANREIIDALKKEGALRNAEKITVASGMILGVNAEFHLPDSTVRKGNVKGRLIDPEFPTSLDYAPLLPA